MTLAPEAWGRLIEDDRTQDLVVPFIGFFQSDDPEFEPADDIAERLVQAATVHASLGFWDVGAPQLVVEWGATVENGMTGPTSLGAEVDSTL